MCAAGAAGERSQPGWEAFRSTRAVAVANSSRSALSVAVDPRTIGRLARAGGSPMTLRLQQEVRVPVPAPTKGDGRPTDRSRSVDIRGLGALDWGYTGVAVAV